MTLLKLLEAGVSVRLEPYLVGEKTVRVTFARQKKGRLHSWNKIIHFAELYNARIDLLEMAYKEAVALVEAEKL